MKRKNNFRFISEESFKLHSHLWYAKYIKPIPIYPASSTKFDTLVYVAKINENQNKPQTAENRNFLNHIEASPFRPINPG